MASGFSRRSRVRWIESHMTYSGVPDLVSRSEIIGDLQSALIVRSSTFQPLV